MCNCSVRWTTVMLPQNTMRVCDCNFECSSGNFTTNWHVASGAHTCTTTRCKARRRIQDSLTQHSRLPNAGACCVCLGPDSPCFKRGLLPTSPLIHLLPWGGNN